MPYQPTLPERKYIETTSIAQPGWLSQPPADLPSHQQLWVEVQQERCLNRLMQRFSHWVVCKLRNTAAQPDTALQATAEMLQIVVEELSRTFAGSAAAILPDRCETQPGQGVAPENLYTVTCIACDLVNLPTPATYWRSQAYRGISLNLGDRLTGGDLQQLQNHFPDQFWQVWDQQASSAQPLLGWLFVSPPPALAGLEREHLQSTYFSLIGRAIDQGTLALQQVRLIQQQQQQQQQLVIRNQELLQISRLKGEFLANTSHEIRTPLSSILGFTHLLREQDYDPNNPKHREYLNIILTSGQHLLALLNDILDLSKIEANQLSLQWEILDVEAICETALMLVREKAHDKGLELWFQRDPSATTLVADGLRLKQMLFNLLSNALKFTPAGRVGLEVRQIDNSLQFKVWDTGSGISAEQQQRLFRPYSQLDNGIATETGTGLGLALTQKLAELHGGTVEVQSQVNRGSCFTISLPLIPPNLENNQPATASSSQEGDRAVNFPVPVITPTPRAAGETVRPAVVSDRPRLLLVEDNPHNARLLMTYLHKTGYEAVWVEDGTAMWQKLQEFIPALILMDINLPGEDGLELTRQLQQQVRYQSIPVIAQTAMAMNGDRDICLAAGARDYISKPIDFQQLASLLTKYI